jgi:hypothetical protein
MAIVPKECWVNSVHVAAMERIVTCTIEAICTGINTKLCMIERTEVLIIVRLIHDQTG